MPEKFYSVSEVAKLLGVSRQAIHDAIKRGILKATKGKMDAEESLAALRGWKFASPRGPILIDSETRDIVMNEYLSEVIMKNGRLFQNTIATVENVKDACKALKIPPCK